MRAEPVVFRKAYNLSDEKLFQPESYLDEGEVPLYSEDMQSIKYMTLEKYKNTYLAQSRKQLEIEKKDKNMEKKLQEDTRSAEILHNIGFFDGG